MKKEDEMGRMSELHAEIVELLNEGEGAEIIAKRLNIPYEWVTDVEEWACGYQDSDDGQPSEYQEWQDYMGGDDWDQGQYDEA
jgi:hypothetical protein